MLSLSPINNIDYYKNLDKDDYYISSEYIGTWHGKLKKKFNLGDQVALDEFDNIMSSKHPKTAKDLFPPNQNIERVAWDLTFSACKSLSILWALSLPEIQENISKAQTNAVKETLDFLEAKLIRVNRGKNGQIKQNSDGVLSLLVNHYTSRELDPNIHTHVLLANMTQAPDGKLMGIDSRNIYNWQKVLGAMYRAELAKQIKAMGISIEQDGESFRLKKIDKRLEPAFSTRTKQIKKELEKYGVRSSASKLGNHVKVKTRKRKKASIMSDLVDSWKSTAKNVLETNEELEQKRTSEPEDILIKLTDKRSSFTLQELSYEVIVENMVKGKGSLNLQKEINTLIQDPELVNLQSDNYKELYTTKRILRIEKQMLNYAKQVHSKNDHRLSNSTVTDAILDFAQRAGFYPSEEQIEALFYSCIESDLAIVQGSAGSGKSTIMYALNIAFLKEGKKVLGAAVMKKAAENLTEESNIPSYTIDKLLTDHERGINIFHNISVLVIDEAGQVPTSKLCRLFELASKNNMKVVLTGEDKQLDAIQHGGSLSYLSEKFGTYRVEKIQRQSEKSQRQIVEYMRDSKMDIAFSKLKNKNLLNTLPSAEDVYSCLAGHVEKYVIENPDKEYLVLAQRWKEVDKISKKLRDIMKDRGVVEYEGYYRKCIVSNHYSDAEFSVGDRIRFTKNDYKLGVSNGTLGRISSLTESNGKLSFQVILNDSRILMFDEDEYSNEDGLLQLYHAYASTIYGSQGLTVNGDTFIAWSTSMGKASTYVAGSRHKEQSHWYFNRAEINEMKANKTESTLDVIARLSSIDKRAKLASSVLSDTRRNVRELSMVT
jgi:conjugative relaxase-like TrwC/TraI family protein